MHRLAVLASGHGSNLHALLAAGLPVTCVVSDRKSAGALDRARDAGIPALFVDPDGCNRATYGLRLQACLAANDVDRILLAGFMRVLDSAFVQRWHGRMLNIHPSLLPKYRGLHTHRRVLEAGDTEHGASVHFVNDELDGGPLVLQVVVPVRPGDDEQILQQRVQEAEHRVYPVVGGWLAAGRLGLGDNGVLLDGRVLAQPFRVTPETDLSCLAA